MAPGYKAVPNRTIANVMNKQIVTINGKTLELVHEKVDSNRPTLVFLHEGLGCIRLWREFPAQVRAAGGYNLLLYNRAGYGHSEPADLPRPLNYLHQEALQVLPELLRTLHIGQHILIGHSDGGSIALLYAGSECQVPGLLGLVTIAAHVFNEEICIRSLEAARQAYLTTNLRQKLARYHQVVDNAFWGWNDTWLREDFRSWNIEDCLPAIHVPTLALQGAGDQYGSPAQLEAIVTGIGSLAQSQLLPGCRHAPHLEQPALTLAYIHEFIKSVSD